MVVLIAGADGRGRWPQKVAQPHALHAQVGQISLHVIRDHDAITICSGGARVLGARGKGIFGAPPLPFEGG